MSPLRGSVVWVHPLLQRYHPYGVEEKRVKNRGYRAVLQGYRMLWGVECQKLYTPLGVDQPRRGEISGETGRTQKQTP